VSVYAFVLHVEEDRYTVAAALAAAMANDRLKILYQDYSVPPAALVGASEIAQFQELISTGLIACSYGVVLISPAFVARSWVTTELESCFRGQDLSRLRFACLGVAKEQVGILSRIVLKNCVSAELGQLGDLASSLRESLTLDESTGITTAHHAGLKPWFFPLLGCWECETHPRLDLTSTNVPPIGASGLLVCPECGVGYAIRDGVPQLLGESGMYPDEPKRKELRALRRASATRSDRN